MNLLLTRKVTSEEVIEAVFSIKSDSALGAEEMSGFFFQKYWDIVGDKLTKEVLCFF